MFWIFKRLSHLEKRVNEMGVELDALKAEEAVLETVVDAIIADHAALVKQLNDAISANDWSGVTSVTQSLTATVDKLKSILPASN